MRINGYATELWQHFRCQPNVFIISTCVLWQINFTKTTYFSINWAHFLKENRFSFFTKKKISSYNYDKVCTREKKNLALLSVFTVVRVIQSGGRLPVSIHNIIWRIHLHLFFLTSFCMDHIMAKQRRFKPSFTFFFLIRFP